MDGTFPLPEAQVDRFLMMISVGYPDLAAEAQVLSNMQSGVRLDALGAVANVGVIASMVSSAGTVHVAPSVIEYIVRLVGATRTVPGVRLGASPRGSVGLLRAARVLAAAEGRHFVTPQDVQRLARPVLSHRLLLTDIEAGPGAAAAVIDQVVATTPAPQA
jgi:MoxR-like ATPase